MHTRVMSREAYSTKVFSPCQLAIYSVSRKPTDCLKIQLNVSGTISVSREPSQCLGNLPIDSRSNLMSWEPSHCLGNHLSVSGIIFATTESRESSSLEQCLRNPLSVSGTNSLQQSLGPLRGVLFLSAHNKRTFSITSSAYTHTKVCRRSTYLHKSRINLLLPLPIRIGFLLVAADRGNDAHKAKVGEDPREQNSKAKKRAELREKLQVAREEGQRRQHRCDHACVAVV